ncbi:MAG TPA: type II secretion system F family protein [Candidatus Pacearchaeota archaeon]|nr:type II secretion system F family protein [Candidatus Pacearchaeota archaeon]
MKNENQNFEKLRKIINEEKKLYKEIYSLELSRRNASIGEKKMIVAHIASIKKSIKKVNDEIPAILNSMEITSALTPKETTPKEQYFSKPGFESSSSKTKKTEISGTSINQIPLKKGYTLEELKPTALERETIKRLKKKQKKDEEDEKEKKPSEYIRLANLLFSKVSDKLVKDKTFEDLERDLIKANMQYTARSYISMIFLSVLISIFIGIIIATFFLFFKLGAIVPFITRLQGDFGLRLIRVIWIPILSPILTFMIMYIFPGLEKTSAEDRINEELPFATIHMSAISGAMIDPSKIFAVLITTKEYPFIEREFKKLLNEINIYGYDLVTALRHTAYNSPSKRLSELLNGLATTVNSGGYLPEFFDKRSQSLLFEYNLEKEKKTKAAETFMDIYISIVIAAPMILMVLLMMMKISGLGISLSTSMITLIMVLSVTMINVVFLTFLQLKR